MFSQTEPLVIPYVYMASVIKPKKRKPESVAIYDVTEISLLQVPDITALTLAFSFDGDTQSQKPIYAYAGRLWSKGQGAQFSAIKALIENNYDGYPYSCPNEDAPFFNCWHRFLLSRNSWLQDAAPVVELPVRTWLSDSKLEIQQHMQDIASSMLIVGDDVYFAAVEPAYQVMTFGLGHNHGGTSIVLTYANHPLADDLYFAADDLDGALRYATEVAIERGDTNNLPMVPHCHIVCHPGAVVTQRMKPTDAS